MDHFVFSCINVFRGQRSVFFEIIRWEVISVWYHDEVSISNFFFFYKEIVSLMNGEWWKVIGSLSGQKTEDWGWCVIVRYIDMPTKSISNLIYFSSICTNRNMRTYRWFKETFGHSILLFHLLCFRHIHW